MVDRAPWALTGAAILAQIAWILVPAGDREAVTVLVVLLFTAASWTHAYRHSGGRWTLAYIAITVGFGFGIELLGHTTDFPFGAYRYTEALQPQILGVPLIVPLAWSMMAYPCITLARAVTTRWQVPLAAAGLTAWDFFLDPQMVGEGFWVWESPTPALPGIPGIPVQNYAGWLLVTMVLMWLLDRLPRRNHDLAVPVVLYTWMWIGGVVANAVFLDRPAVALVGGVTMAGLGVPAVLAWRRT